MALLLKQSFKVGNHNKMENEEKDHLEILEERSITLAPALRGLLRVFSN